MAGKSPYNWAELTEQFINDHQTGSNPLPPKKWLEQHGIPYTTGRRHIKMTLLNDLKLPSDEALPVVKKAKQKNAGGKVATKTDAAIEASEKDTDKPPLPNMVTGVYSTDFFTELRDYCQDFYKIDDLTAEISGLTIVREATQRLMLSQMQALAEGRLDDAVMLKTVALSKMANGKAVSENWSIDTLFDHYHVLNLDLIKAKKEHASIKKAQLEIEKLERFLGGGAESSLHELMALLMGVSSDKKREGLPSEFSDDDD